MIEAHVNTDPNEHDPRPAVALRPGKLRQFIATPGPGDLLRDLLRPLQPSIGPRENSNSPTRSFQRSANLVK